MGWYRVSYVNRQVCWVGVRVSWQSVTEQYRERQCNFVEYTIEEYTEMLIIYGEAARNGRAAQRIYEERFRIAALHHIPFSPYFNNGYEIQVPSKVGRLTVVLHERAALSTLKGMSFSTWTRTRRRVLEHFPCLGCPPHERMACFAWTAIPPIPPSESSCIEAGRFCATCQFLTKVSVCNEHQGSHVEPLGVCNANSETRHTVSAHCVSIFQSILHRNGTFPDMGALTKFYLLSPLYNSWKSVILILKHSVYYQLTNHWGEK